MLNVAPLDDGLIDSQAGFDAATKRILPALHGYARRLTQNNTSSQDLVQETLVRAWAARLRFLPGSNFKAWLFRIARNTFLMGVRRSWRSTQFDPVAHGPLLVGPAGQEDGLFLEDLDRALATLPATQRDALLLVVREGLSYEEAAIAQHVPLGTVRSRVSRARHAVMCYFDDEASRRPAEHPVEVTKAQEVADVRGSSRYEAWKAAGTRTIG
jgi:RNA polymerase sigma-70 factor (ECF subfamily)